MTAEARDESFARGEGTGLDSGAENVVVVDGTRYKTAKEGLARIYVPLSGGDRKERQNGGGGPSVDDHPQQVFYNPIQQFNRDLSVLAIKAYGTATIEKRAEAAAKKRKEALNKKRKRREERSQQHAAPTEAEAEAEPQSEAADERVVGVDGERLAKVEKSAEGQDAAQAVTELASRGANDQNDTNGTNAETTQPVPHSQSTPQTSPQPPKIRILDALSATGLRALRYAHELPFNVSVTANDLLAAATESIRRNVSMNGLTEKIEVTHSDALAHMYTVISKDLMSAAEATSTKNAAAAGSRFRPSAKYDVIDLDPYGTGANFFDAAVQSVRSDGGLLCVTCTDAGVWASQGYPEKCYALYGGVPMKGAASHEAGLRIVLHALATSAARYGLTITPLLSLSIDFYCRVFVTVTRSPASVKFLAGKTMTVYNCDQGCGAWATQPLLRTHSHPNKKGSGIFFKYTFAAGPTASPRCEHCDTKMHLSGPMYAGPIHQAEFVQRILDDLPQVSTDVYGTTDRIRGMLHTALEEIMEPETKPTPSHASTVEPPVPLTGDDALAAVDPAPFFFLPTNLAKAVHCSTPGEDPIRGALLRLGYRVTRSHCKPGSLKTDASWSVLWDIMRAFVRQKAPVKRENIRPNTAAHRLLRLHEGDEGADGAEGADRKEAEGEGKAAKEDLTTNAAGKPEAIVFDEDLGRQLSRSGEKLVRYQVNPRENWGPMNRAKGK
ncbi:N2,N2-dimethylguanosine tRNA methyltransferase [Sporothrix schenckii ATCC 58251]|uniref:tRNA (guanine(26)-N(2))-dimethyltransferase n=2 Tax=Sporothrix schenckii TaxID=29908 RepID=U7Q6E1_SPOS1|nr:N2,N2-dimethylguanosine tRNA methyltransferase [Sporothrix schenckii ATCC 58251]